jgi:hypothetical protein
MKIPIIKIVAFNNIEYFVSSGIFRIITNKRKIIWKTINETTIDIE